VRRLMCDPVADFTIGGEATPTGAGGAVKEKCSVWLSARPGVGAATVVKAPGAADPAVSSQWSAGRPGLPPAGAEFRFFAPGVAAETAVSLGLRVRLDAGASGALESAATRTLAVRPLAGPVEMGPELALAPVGGALGALRLDRRGGL